MKKTYETPVAEKVEFQYQEQVVASACGERVLDIADSEGICSNNPSHYEKLL